MSTFKIFFKNLKNLVPRILMSFVIVNDEKKYFFHLVTFIIFYAQVIIKIGNF